MVQKIVKYVIEIHSSFVTLGFFDLQRARKKMGSDPIILMSILILAWFLSGCYGMAHYEMPPYQIDQFGTGEQPVKPSTYKVISKDYPEYRVVEKIKPPNIVSVANSEFGSNQETELVQIEKTDIWKVTHKIGSRFIIQSEEYNKRQVQSRNEYFKRKGYNTFFSRMTDTNLYGVYINARGEVDGGWELLHRSNRYMYMYWHPAKNDGWPKGPIFIPMIEAKEN